MWFLGILQYVLGFFGGFYLMQGIRERKVKVVIMSIALIVGAFLSSYGFCYLKNI